MYGDDDDGDVLTVHQVVQMVEWEWQTKMYLCTANAEKFNIYLPKKSANAEKCESINYGKKIAADKMYLCTANAKTYEFINFGI